MTLAERREDGEKRRSCLLADVQFDPPFSPADLFLGVDRELKSSDGLGSAYAKSEYSLCQDEEPFARVAAREKTIEAYVWQFDPFVLR